MQCFYDVNGTGILEYKLHKTANCHWGYHPWFPCGLQKTKAALKKQLALTIKHKTKEAAAQAKARLIPNPTSSRWQAACAVEGRTPSWEETVR